MEENTKLTEELAVETTNEESGVETVLDEFHKNCSQPNFYIRTSIRPNGNFLIFNDEILHYKDENGKPLDDKTIGHFVRLFALASGNWIYKQKGTATITNACTNTVSARDKKLKQLGYLEEHVLRDESGRFEGRIYILNETLNKDVRNNDSIPQEVLNRINNKSELKNQEMDNAGMKNSLPYIEYKINQKKNKKRIDSISLVPNSKENSSKTSKEVNNVNSCIYSHEYIINDSFSNNHDNNDSQDNQLNMKSCTYSNNITIEGNLTNLNNSNGSTCTNNSSGKSKSKPGRKSKADILKEKVMDIVNEESNEELRTVLTDYVDVIFDSGKILVPKQFITLLGTLEEYSDGSDFRKIKIVKNAIQGAYTRFIPLNNKELSKIKEEEYEDDPDYYTPATDENGNLLMFY